MTGSFFFKVVVVSNGYVAIPMPKDQGMVVDYSKAAYGATPEDLAKALTAMFTAAILETS